MSILFLEKAKKNRKIFFEQTTEQKFFTVESNINHRSGSLLTPHFKNKVMSKVSDCCGASNIDFEDYGICPDCREHCEFIEIDDEEESQVDELYHDHPDFLKAEDARSKK